MTPRSDDSVGRRRRVTGSWANWVWLAAYAITLVVVVVLMVAATAQADWQAWRQSVPNQTQSGGVKRRPPSSAEPPALVLLRDHFAVMIAGALLFSSLLFGAIMVAARGTFAASGKNVPGGPNGTPDV